MRIVLLSSTVNTFKLMAVPFWTMVKRRV
jgi:hypothetical protein